MVETFSWILKLVFLTLFLVSEVFCGITSFLWFLEETLYFQASFFPTLESQNLKVIALLVGLFFSAFCLFCFTQLEEKE
jgi:uncharacterized metal-binding protein